MEFKIIEEACNFWVNYAENMALILESTIIIIKVLYLIYNKYTLASFIYSNEDFYFKDKLDNAIKYHHLEIRIDCQAHFIVKLLRKSNKYKTI
jgi:hypothetical protein